MKDTSTSRWTARILATVLAGLLGAASVGCAARPERRDLETRLQQQASYTPQQVLDSLKSGNDRFAAGKPQKRDMLHDQQVTSAGQHPWAVVLSCIDSRAPAEFVFDAGIGDIFNARVAGNIANPDIVGSIEYATKVAGAKLVLVMGHTACGAVKSACDHVEMGNITELLNKIEPAVDSVKDVPGERNSKNKKFVEEVTVANVRMTMAKIRELSPILRELETQGQIMIVGCVYDLDTGRVKFLGSAN